MIPVQFRAEKLCMDVLLANPEIMAIYGKNRIYQGYVEANTLTRLDYYILIKRIDGIKQDATTTGSGADRLRRVSVQIDVSDTRYSDMVRRAEMIKEILNEAFPSCVIDDAYGTDGRGQKVFNVCSIDAHIWEAADGNPYNFEEVTNG